jgi:Sec-independent protein translocase protein TatA
MFNLGPEKLMMVLLVALIVLGPDKLPNAARQVGRYLDRKSTRLNSSHP